MVILSISESPFNLKVSEIKSPLTSILVSPCNVHRRLSSFGTALSSPGVTEDKLSSPYLVHTIFEKKIYVLGNVVNASSMYFVFPSTALCCICRK